MSVADGRSSYSPKWQGGYTTGKALQQLKRFLGALRGDSPTTRGLSNELEEHVTKWLLGKKMNDTTFQHPIWVYLTYATAKQWQNSCSLTGYTKPLHFTADSLYYLQCQKRRLSCCQNIANWWSLMVWGYEDLSSLYLNACRGRIWCRARECKKNKLCYGTASKKDLCPAFCYEQFPFPCLFSGVALPLSFNGYVYFSHRHSSHIPQLVN